MITVKRLYIVLLVVGVIYAWKSASGLEMPDIDWAATNLTNIGLAIASQLLFWLLMSFSWRQTLHYAIQRKISLLAGFYHISFLLVGKYLPGKVWGMVARGAALKEQNIELSSIVKATYLEQFIMLHAGAVVGAIGLALTYRGRLAWILLLSSGLSMLMLPLFNKYLINASIQWVNRNRRKELSLNLDISMSHYLVLFGISSLEWITVGAVLLFLSTGFVGLPSHDIESVQIVTFAATALLIGFVALFAPGGIGIRESVLTYLLSTIMAVESALFVAVLYRIWLTLWDVLAGVIAFLLTGVKRTARTVHL